MGEILPPVPATLELINRRSLFVYCKWRLFMEGVLGIVFNAENVLMKDLETSLNQK
uniref:Uncharacterized protein n=1 Tax=uncultured bacterium contig00117 TaxID=1181578 RepID=A0A806JYZ5_9BACT|nr:hypothetical protein [uncultured bacterium contig00117]